MSKIETARYSATLRRFLGMKGVVDVAAELSPEISPTLQLEAELPEWEFLKGAKLMSSVASVTGVAAVNTGIRLVNGIQSGALCRFLKILISVDNNALIIVERNLAQANFSTLFPTVARDTRLPLLNASTLIVSGQTTAAPSGESFWSANLLGSTPQDALADRGSFILTPNHQLQITSVTNQITLRTTCWWLERPIDVLERQ